MKNEDMQTKVFDPIVDRVLNLINRQRRQAENEGRKIDAILMFGGFSQSRYFQQRINDKYRGRCSVIIPYEGVTAISHGAVMVIIINVYSILNNSSIFLRSFISVIFSCDPKQDANNRFVTNSHTKIMETRVVMPPAATGIEKGEIIEFKVSLQMEPIGVTVTIVCQNALMNANIRMKNNNEKLSLLLKSKCILNVLKHKPLIEYSPTEAEYVFDLRVKSSDLHYT